MTKPSQSLKFFASFLAGLLFVTNSVLAYAPESNFWAERRQSLQLPSPSKGVLQSSVSSLKNQFPKGEKTLGSITQTLSHQYGRVRKIIQPHLKQENRIVIHVQDIHLNREAQTNMAAAMKKLINNSQVDLIALEGAFEQIDLAPLRTFPHPNTIKKVSDYLLRENKISGPLYAALTSPHSLPPVVGVDHQHHYERNVQAYRKSLKFKDQNLKKIRGIGSQIKNSKQKVFSGKLLAFDQKVEAYRLGEMKMGAYLTFLSKELDVDSKEIQLFLQALALEQSLNLNQVERERSQLLNRLLHRLDKAKTNTLINASLAYRTGKIPHADFYQAIETLCEQNNVPFQQFPAMAQYLQYILLSEKIQAEALLKEIDLAQKKLYANLAKTKQERLLIEKSKAHYLIGKLLNFALTPEEWDAYESLPREHWRLDLSSFEAFYKEAIMRDQAMAENLLKAMDESKAKVAILVTGGFHSPGINQIMEKANVTNLAFVPKITKIETAKGSEYLGVFTQEKTPLQKLFEGEKLFLARLATSGIEDFIGLTVTVGQKDPTETLRAMTPHIKASISARRKNKKLSSTLTRSKTFIHLPNKHQVIVAEHTPEGVKSGIRTGTNSGPDPKPLGVKLTLPQLEELSQMDEEEEHEYLEELVEAAPKKETNELILDFLKPVLPVVGVLITFIWTLLHKNWLPGWTHSFWFLFAAAIFVFVVSLISLDRANQFFILEHTRDPGAAVFRSNEGTFYVGILNDADKDYIIQMSRYVNFWPGLVAISFLASSFLMTAVGFVWIHQDLFGLQLLGYLLILGGVAAFPSSLLVWHIESKDRHEKVNEQANNQPLLTQFKRKPRVPVWLLSALNEDKTQKVLTEKGLLQTILRSPDADLVRRLSDYLLTHPGVLAEAQTVVDGTFSQDIPLLTGWDRHLIGLTQKIVSMTMQHLEESGHIQKRKPEGVDRRTFNKFITKAVSLLSQGLPGSPVVSIGSKLLKPESLQEEPFFLLTSPEAISIFERYKEQAFQKGLFETREEITLYELVKPRPVNLKNNKVYPGMDTSDQEHYYLRDRAWPEITRAETVYRLRQSLDFQNFEKILLSKEFKNTISPYIWVELELERHIGLISVDTLSKTEESAPFFWMLTDSSMPFSEAIFQNEVIEALSSKNHPLFLKMISSLQERFPYPGVWTLLKKTLPSQVALEEELRMLQKQYGEKHGAEIFEALRKAPEDQQDRLFEQWFASSSVPKKTFEGTLHVLRPFRTVGAPDFPPQSVFDFSEKEKELLEKKREGLWENTTIVQSSVGPGQDPVVVTRRLIQQAITEKQKGHLGIYMGVLSKDHAGLDQLKDMIKGHDNFSGLPISIFYFDIGTAEKISNEKGDWEAFDSMLYKWSHQQKTGLFELSQDDIFPKVPSPENTNTEPSAQYATLLIEKYTLDPEKAKELAPLIEKSSVETDEEGLEILVYEGKKLAEILPLGSIRYFDQNGRWILTLDPFGNPVEQLKWDSENKFEQAILWNVDREPYVLKSLKDTFQSYQVPGRVHNVIHVRDLDRDPFQYSLYYFHEGFDFANDPGKISGAGPNYPGLKSPGLGFSVLNLASFLARDQKQKLVYVGKVPTPMIQHGLNEVGVESYEWENFSQGHLDNEKLEWTPAPHERVFNPNGMFVSVRDGKIYRAYNIEDRTMSNISKGQIKQDENQFILNPEWGDELKIDIKGNVEEGKSNLAEAWSSKHIVVPVVQFLLRSIGIPKHLVYRAETRTGIVVVWEAFRHVAPVLVLGIWDLWGNVFSVLLLGQIHFYINGRIFWGWEHHDWDLVLGPLASMFFIYPLGAFLVFKAPLWLGVVGVLSMALVMAYHFRHDLKKIKSEIEWEQGTGKWAAEYIRKHQSSQEVKDPIRFKTYAERGAKYFLLAIFITWILFSINLLPLPVAVLLSNFLFFNGLLFHLDDQDKKERQTDKVEIELRPGLSSLIFFPVKFIVKNCFGLSLKKMKRTNG